MTTYSDTFNSAINNTLQFEGGYSFDPNDPGGETNFGISKNAYPSVDIKDLTRDDAIAIYYRDFWSPYPYDQINSSDEACKIFDTTVNLGVPRGIKLMQKCLVVNGFPNMSVDGGFGPQTLAALNSVDSTTMLAAYRAAQAAYYNLLVQQRPSDAEYLTGWLRRANS